MEILFHLFQLFTSATRLISTCDRLSRLIRWVSAVGRTQWLPKRGVATSHERIGAHRPFRAIRIDRFLTFSG